MCQANLGLIIPYTMLSKWVWEWYFVLYRQNVLAKGSKEITFFNIVQKMELWIKISFFANLVFEFWCKTTLISSWLYLGTLAKKLWYSKEWSGLIINGLNFQKKKRFLVLYGITSSPGDVVHVRWKRVWRILRWSWDGLPSLSYLPHGKHSPLI